MIQTLLLNEMIINFQPFFSKYKNNYELYINFWRPFGDLLTEMEREGIKIDLDYLRVI